MPPQCLYCAVCGTRLPHPLAAGGVVGGRIQVERGLTAKGKHLLTFLAKDKQSGQPMVLKELRDDLRATPQEKQELMDEVRALQGLRLSGIQPVRGVVQHEGRSYLALGYAPGQTLRSVLAKTPRLSPDQALQLLRAAATALQELHDQFPPLLHLDVTPDNILMSGWDKLVLLDGNWLRRLGNPFSPALPYDEAYAAPELVRGQPMAASDLYALGVTIVEAVTGTPAARLFDPNTNRLAWTPIAHPLLQEVLVRLTEGAVTQRFESAAQVLKALAEGTLPAMVTQPSNPYGTQQAPVAPVAPPPPPPPVAPPPVPTAPRLTSTALQEAAASPPPPPPAAPPPPPPPPPPPVRREPVKPIENIDDVSTEEGLDALMALYEAQNS
jgi:serine/threonine protein kinase